MVERRRRHEAAYSLRIVLVALEGGKTISQLLSEHGIHFNQIGARKRELPRIHLASSFRAFAEARAWLTETHVCYEEQSAYSLEALDWRVERTRLSKDKTQLGKAVS